MTNAIKYDGTKQAAKLIVQDLWRRACKFDGIEPGASFVVFSASNPWEARYNLAVQQYLLVCKSIEVS